ncbi:MAG: FAD-dependent monooxygenase [Gammaproteobacteria bacterium]|nr:FAD-dependent monooxygenase [Gammaproteobacteria bacterium]
MGETITIAGAGLAGSLLSIYLARRGFDVHLIERRDDMRRHKLSAGRSINLALANRGLRALDAVGLGDSVRPLLITMKGRMLHENDQLHLQPYGKNDQEVIYSVSRPGLNRLLLDTAEAHGVRISFNQTLCHVDVDSATITVRDNVSGDQYQRECHPLIATDGSGSLTRRTLAFSPGATSAEEFLEHGYKELTIPADANGDHRIEKHALHIWPRGGFMLIALPNLDGSFTVTLFMPREGETSFASLDSHDAVTDFFTRTFHDALELMPDLATEFFANPTGRMVTVRCKPWYRRDKVLLLGDAAHAIVPFHGQGMNCAFEDCLVFDRLLAGESTHAVDWRSVFALFQAQRLDNANAIADLALENYIVMRESVRDPRFHLKKALSWELEKRFPKAFIPRYSMVMFHHIPYATAQSRGVIQEQLLEELIGDNDTLDHVDYASAKTLIDTRLGNVPESA